MKTRGFTLIELLGVIVILGLVAAFSVPTLTKTFKETADKQYREFAKSITLAAENYFHNELDGNIDSKKFITVGELVQNGYLKKEINPLTEKPVSESSTVVVSKNTDGTESYVFVDRDVTETGYNKDSLLVLFDGYHNIKDGQWNDLSGNGNNGMVYGPVWVSNGMKFDGIDDYILVNQKSQFPSGQALYTLEVAFYYNQLKERNNLINLGIYDSPGNANGIYIMNSKKISHWYWSNDLRTDDLVEANKSYVITATYDGDNRKVYLNGNLVVKDEAIPNVILGNITIGDEIPGQDGFFNSTIHSVRIYNRALTNEEIYNNYMVDKYRFGVE